MTKKETKNTNGFPLNGGFPEWITKKTCANCDKELNYHSYSEIGFFIHDKYSGKLFVRYNCQNCQNESTIEFGDEKFTIERLCTLVIQHSNILKTSQQNDWKNKHINP